jgi:hypothetical protein
MSRLKEIWKLLPLFIIANGVLPMRGQIVDGSRIVDASGEVRYERVQGSFTWEQAKLDAESRGGYLAVITSHEEQDLVTQISGDSSLWIGGNDTVEEGKWEWVTGEPFDYTNWAGGEPNNCCDGEDHLMMYADGRWNDQFQSTMSYLIEYEMHRPLIHLNGKYVERHRQGKLYVDPGATAMDEEDGAIDVVVRGTVDVHTLGDFRLQYTAIDSDGNQAVPAERIVRIVDPYKPLIYLNGPSDLIHEIGSPYTDQGATAFDLNEQAVDVTFSGDVDLFNLGSYTLTYRAADAEGREALPVERVVRVVDKNFKYLTFFQRPTGMAMVRCQTAAAGVVHIPDMVDGKPVIEIGMNAFYGCSGITEVILPESVAQLGAGAFSNCSKLTAINLPQGLTALPDQLFNHCTSLNQIHFPEGLRTIGHDAFNHAGLHSVLLPEGVISLGDRAFSNNAQLESVMLPGTLDQVSWECFRNSYQLNEVVLAEGITRLRGYSFRDTCPS